MKTLSLVLFTLALGAPALGIGRNYSKLVNAKVWVHLMPWFETRETSDNGEWGIHWTMANMNPDNVDGTGKREIAAHFYPEIGPYASGDPTTIEYQLNLMKYSGIDGVLIDWPGTVVAWDYPKNKENSERIIAACERLGLEWAIVYEDHNIGMAADAGLISDRIGAGQADMIYLRDNYFNKQNYIKVNGAPLLLVFGPQTFQDPGSWEQVFQPFSQKPTFLTLWYQGWQSNDAKGEYCWLYVDFLQGLSNFYNYREVEIKMGNAYPGFQTFYERGGWPGNPGWTIQVGEDTFQSTLDLAVNAKDVPYIQLVTWNDYGEGTMIEPTREFGNSFLNRLQSTLGVPFDNEDLQTVKLLRTLRVHYRGKQVANADLDVAAQLLAEFRPKEALQHLRKLAF